MTKPVKKNMLFGNDSDEEYDDSDDDVLKNTKKIKPVKQQPLPQVQVTNPSPQQ